MNGVFERNNMRDKYQFGGLAAADVVVVTVYQSQLSTDFQFTGSLFIKSGRYQ